MNGSISPTSRSEAAMQLYFRVARSAAETARSGSNRSIGTTKTVGSKARRSLGAKGHRLSVESRHQVLRERGQTLRTQQRHQPFVGEQPLDRRNDESQSRVTGTG